MRILLDMNMPAPTAGWLRLPGHDCFRLRELGLGRLTDEEVFAHAVADRRVIVTMDLGFGEIVGLAGGGKVGVVLLRLRALSSLRDRLSVALSQAEPALQAGAIVIVQDARIRVRPASADLD
jgi:predicted nuclease of predicted toxin-antitoxin system